MRNLERVVLIIITLSSACLLNCATSRINKVMQSWEGAHKGDLILSWGPPSQVVSDGRGGEILIYEFHRDLGQTSGKVYVDAYGNLRYTNPKDRGYVATRMFYVNKKGIIYSWRWKGL